MMIYALRGRVVDNNIFEKWKEGKKDQEMGENSNKFFYISRWNGTATQCSSTPTSFALWNSSGSGTRWSYAESQKMILAIIHVAAKIIWENQGLSLKFQVRSSSFFLESK